MVDLQAIKGQLNRKYLMGFKFQVIACEDNFTSLCFQNPHNYLGRSLNGCLKDPITVARIKSQNSYRYPWKAESLRISKMCTIFIHHEPFKLYERLKLIPKFWSEYVKPHLSSFLNSNKLVRANWSENNKLTWGLGQMSTSAKNIVELFPK